MGVYIEDEYAVLDGVILNYSGREQSLKIPDTIGDMTVTQIGDGAFMETELEAVMIPETVKRIGENAFEYSPLVNVYLPATVEKIEDRAFMPRGDEDCLRNIVVYGQRLSASDYNELKLGSIPVNKGHYMAMSYVKIGALEQAVGAAGIGFASYLPVEAKNYYTFHSKDSKSGANPLAGVVERISSDAEQDCRRETEESAFMKLICRKTAPYSIAAAEVKNDDHMRKKTYPSIKKTAIVCYDDSKTRSKGDTYVLDLQLKIGYHFWQSFVPVSASGKQYYIYRRNYLTSDEALPYIRRDVAVFTEKGLVKNREEALAVYGKYKFLSLL